MIGLLSLEQSTTYEIVKYNQLHTEIPKYWHELNMIKLGDKVLKMYYTEQQKVYFNNIT